LPKLEKIGDRYEVIEQIGHGGQAAIFRALDTRMEREVALKVVFFPHSRDQEVIEQILEVFRHEILVVGRLSHTNIVQVYDFGLDHAQNAAYMVMQLLHGSTVKELLTESGPPPPREALRIMGVLVRTLYYLHENQVIHRDMKPSNVFISRGEPVIIDFGISSSQEKTVTLTGASLSGSQPYLCPELVNPKQAREFRRHTRRDVWGLGMIGFELVTGASYFDDEADPAEIVGLLSNSSAMRRDMADRMGGHPLSKLVLEMLDSQEVKSEWAEQIDEQLRHVNTLDMPASSAPSIVREPYESELGARMRSIAPDPTVSIPREGRWMYCMICRKPVWSQEPECPHCGAERLYTTDAPRLEGRTGMETFGEWIWDKIKLILFALFLLALLVGVLGICVSVSESVG